jgi:MoxR-like ATPase
MDTMTNDFEHYRGDGSVRPLSAPAGPETAIHHEQRGDYRASRELAEAVNLAIAVEQPLLVTGEPGCGKTRLAWSVAKELDLGEPLPFYTKSTSRAQDLLYRYDAVRHFKDIQLKLPDASDVTKYICYEALGKAVLAQARRVVLVDEIDKAPRDFPNDLLTELDRMQFVVHELPEAERLKETRVRPIVIITSNSERQLPLPFLRRCVFHHIEFPKPAELVAILTERLKGSRVEADLIRAAVDQFTRVRAIPKLNKKPATGELLTWVVGLVRQGVTAAELGRVSVARLPLWQALVKDRDDFKRLQEAGA